MANNKKTVLAPMAAESIHAGFPSPAQDYMNPCIDLNRELVLHPSATFYGRVVGDSMIDAGVEEGDILVIDKAIEPKEGDMAVCFVDGEFALKFISFHSPEDVKPIKSKGKVLSSYNILEHKNLWLLPANKSYKPIEITESNDFTVWGVVTYVIKKIVKK
jgi:DNA polymerase V